MKRVCIVAIPRTGTNNLCHLMSYFKGLRSYYELFHKQGVFSLKAPELEALSSELGIKVDTFSDARAIAFARSRPKAFLNLLARFNERDKVALSFKIFPGQLEERVLFDEIFSEERTVFLMIKRRLIDCYISDKKAEVSGEYHFVDTTNIKVELRAADYLNWVGYMTRWYAECEEALSNRGCRWRTLSYENDLCGTGEQVLAKVGETLRDLDLLLPLRDARITTLPIQDRQTGHERKVSNWHAFSEELRRAGLKEL